MSWLQYTRMRYGLFIAVGVILTLSAIIWTAYVIRMDYRERQEAFVRDVNTFIFDETARLSRQVRYDLRTITTAQISPDSLFAVPTWDGFFADRPYLSALAVYDATQTRTVAFDRRGRALSAEDGNCLPNVLPRDGYCEYHAFVAFRVAVPLPSPHSAMVAMCVLSPLSIKQAAHDANLSVLILSRGAILYSTAETQTSLTLPGLAIDRLMFWITRERPYFIRSRVLDESSALQIICLRSATALLFNAIQGIAIVALISSGYFGLLHYFVVNYRMISKSYRNIFDNLPDLICLTDVHGRLKYINQAMAVTLFGTTPRLLIVTQPRKALLSMYQHLLAMEARARQSGLTVQGELSEGHHTYSVLIVPVAVRGGIEVVTCLRDLTTTEMIRHDAEMWRNSALIAQQTLNAIFDLSPDWLCIFDERGDVVSAGRQMTADMRSQFGVLRADLADATRHVQRRFLWTVTTHATPRTFATTCFHLQDSPPRYLLLASDVTLHTAWQSELESAVSLMTSHILRQTQQRRRTDRVLTDTDALPTNDY